MRWVWIVLPAALVFLLALVGIEQSGIAANTTDRLYFVLQLFTVNADWLEQLHPLPWQLNLARFLAPVTTIGSFVFVFAEGVRITLGNALARFDSRHAIAVGLDDTTLYFLRACAQARRRITLLAERKYESRVAEVRQLGHRVIVCDRIDGAVLLRAGLRRATHLVAFTDDDGANVEIALRAKRLLAETNTKRPDGPLQIRLHLADTRLALQLEAYPKFFEHFTVAEVSFFNVHERSARQLFAQYPMELYADVFDAQRVHFSVIGTGPLCTQIVLQALRQAHYADGARPKVTILGERIAPAHRAFEAAYPHAAGAGDIEWIEIAYDEADLERTLPWDRLASVTTCIVCLEPDVRALRFTLALRRAMLAGRAANVPIFVAMRLQRGIARLLESGTGQPEIPDGIFPFGTLDEVLTEDQILDERQDHLARALHDDYQTKLPTAPAGTLREPPSHRSWNLLPEEFRRENRMPADHVQTKLRAVDRELTAEGSLSEFDAAEVELLAPIEQRRWNAARINTGWTFGVPREDTRRVHDALRVWDELTDSQRQRQRESIRALPRIVHLALQEQFRKCVFIGITGHRPHRLPASLAPLDAALRRTFAAISREHPNCRIVLLSSLAAGADRLAARVALDGFDARLMVPLPLPYESYIESFGEADANDREAGIAEFHELVGRAQCYFEMPLRFGNHADLAAPAGEPLRARQYALAGAYIVQRCHELIGVWDGNPEAGEGGTAQVLRWRMNGVPAEYRFANRFHPERGRTAPWIVPADPDASFEPQRSADLQSI